MGWPPFIVVPCVGATWLAQGARKGGNGSARQQSGRAGVRLHGTAATGVMKGTRRGRFCPYAGVGW
jgi:hypothetical protein